MKRSGSADLPLHHGHVPRWLYTRMSQLGLAITEAIITEYGTKSFLSRMSDPFWFQSFGAVLGMDWHSSGITTSVLGSLKRAINPIASDMGIYICGGKGKHSRGTPGELIQYGGRSGINADHLVHCSKLTAKVDNTAIQDGFQLYLHHFIVSKEGDWTVIQQGMRDQDAMARRYHWHSEHVTSFLEEPHTGVCGVNLGPILNLTASEAASTKQGILNIAAAQPEKMMKEINHLLMPRHHDVTGRDVDMKRLGAALWLAHESGVENFEDLLMMQGVGPRTIQSLTLVSEIVHGTPSRFKDPARFSFAHGGKDGHPFPVPVKTYDESISHLRTAVEKARIGHSEKAEAIKKLHQLSARAEKEFMVAEENTLQQLIDHERAESWKYGGRTVFGDAVPPPSKKPFRKKGVQLRLF